MKFLSCLLITIIAALVPIFGLTSLVGAETFDPLSNTCTAAENNSDTQLDAQKICDNSKTPGDPVNDKDNGIVVKLANLLALAAAILAVVVVIVAGITMMTSDGDAGKVASSRNAIIYTVIGLIVIVTARTIVVFVMLRSATP
jgi:hypothetical protein